MATGQHAAPEQILDRGPGEAREPFNRNTAALPASGESRPLARPVDGESGLPRNAQAGGIRPDVLARVLDLIEHRYHEPLRVDDLGRHACLSPFHFARMFKISVGQAPHAYITTRRMQRARELLSRSEMPIAEVARSVGFRTQAHFSGVFRKHEGATPGQFRRQHRNGPAAPALPEQ